MNPRTIHTAVILLLFVFGIMTTGFILLGGSSDQMVEEVDNNLDKAERKFSEKKDHFVLNAK